MSTVHGTMLGFTMAIGALACSAQNVNVPFRQIEKDAQMSAKLEALGNEPAAMRSYGSSSASSSSSALVLEPPAVKPPGPSALDSSCSMDCIWAWLSLTSK